MRKETLITPSNMTKDGLLFIAKSHYKEGTRINSLVDGIEVKLGAHVNIYMTGSGDIIVSHIRPSGKVGENFLYDHALKKWATILIGNDEIVNTAANVVISGKEEFYSVFN